MQEARSTDDSRAILNFLNLLILKSEQGKISIHYCLALLIAVFGLSTVLSACGDNEEKDVIVPTAAVIPTPTTAVIEGPAPTPGIITEVEQLEVNKATLSKIQIILANLFSSNSPQAVFDAIAKEEQTAFNYEYTTVDEEGNVIDLALVYYGDDGQQYGVSIDTHRGIPIYWKILPDGTIVHIEHLITLDALRSISAIDDMSEIKADLLVDAQAQHHSILIIGNQELVKYFRQSGRAERLFTWLGFIFNNYWSNMYFRLVLDFTGMESITYPSIGTSNVSINKTVTCGQTASGGGPDNQLAVEIYINVPGTIARGRSVGIGDENVALLAVVLQEFIHAFESLGFPLQTVAGMNESYSALVTQAVYLRGLLGLPLMPRFMPDGTEAILREVIWSSKVQDIVQISSK